MKINEVTEEILMTEAQFDEAAGEQEFSKVVVKGNNVKIPTVAQQLGWKTEPSAFGREFTTILPGSKPLIKTAIDKFISSLGLKFSSGDWAKKPVAEDEETYDGDGPLTEAQFDEAAGEKDACYHKVKSRYKVWPSAYASGALVKCRKVGAANWGEGGKKK